MATHIEHMRVEANGIVFHVAACGPEKAQPVVILHGFPESWVSWKPIMERLGEKFRIYAPDLRGYGGTSKPEGGYDSLTLTDDVNALMDALKLDRPVLIGHDWGGALAWVFGHRFGERLKHLIVVNCTHPVTMSKAIFGRRDGQHRKSWYMFAFQLPRAPERVLSSRNGAVLKRLYKSQEGRPGAMNMALVDEIVSGFRSPEDLRGPVNYYRMAMRAQFVPELRDAFNRAMREPIKCPTTMIWGDRDKALAIGPARRSGEDAGRPVEFRVLPGVGHFVSLEAPDELAHEIDMTLSVTTEKSAPESRAG